MGGTNDKSNIIELTPAEHAAAHQKLYEEHGCWQDYVAWQGLLKLDKNFDAAKEAMIQGGKKGSYIANEQWKDPILKAKRIEKFKKSMNGRWPTTGKKGSLNPYAKTYLITHPNGYQEKIVSLKLWCETHGLKYNTVFNICVGLGKLHKGFKITKVV